MVEDIFQMKTLMITTSSGRIDKKLLIVLLGSKIAQDVTSHGQYLCSF